MDCIYENCIKKAGNTSTATMINCASAEYDVVDKKLNASYSRLLKLLPLDGQKRLRQAERSWLKFLHDECSFSGYAMANGTGEHVLISGCYLGMTKERLIALNRGIKFYRKYY